MWKIAQGRLGRTSIVAVLVAAGLSGCTYRHVLGGRELTPEEAARRRTLSVAGAVAGVVLAAAGGYALHRGMTACDRHENGDECWLSELGGLFLGVPALAGGVTIFGYSAYQWGAADASARVGAGAPPVPSWRGLSFLPHAPPRRWDGMGEGDSGAHTSWRAER
jgi:hypothetical protein